MGYAIPRIAKLKSFKDMADRYSHNMRIFHVLNADPTKIEDNVELTDQLNGRTYVDMYKDTVRELRIDGAITKDVRHDAVKGYEVMLTFSRENASDMDVKAWADANVEWLERTFNPPDRQIHFIDNNGEEVSQEINNVKNVMLHLDEEVPHIHAFVLPIDEKGHFNARYYTGSRSSIIKMQDSYAKAMEPFGLKRGERHSVATHEERSEYYSKLKNAVNAELPEPKRGESVEEYRIRAQEVYRTEQVTHRNEIVKKDQEIVQAKSMAAEARILANGLDREGRLLAKEVGEDELSPETIRTIRKIVGEHEDYKKAVSDHPDREKAKRTETEYQEMVRWGRKNRKERTRSEKEV